MEWTPNIDAGIESGPYEIYGPFPDGFSLLYHGEKMGRYKTQRSAMKMAESHSAVVAPK